MSVNRSVKPVSEPIRNFSYLHNPDNQPLNYITLGQLLEKTAQKHPDRKAVISKHQNQSLTFSELLLTVDKLGAGLRSIGLQKSDRVGIWAPNLTEWYLTNMACARAGLISVCLNPVYETSEMEYCINKVGIKAIVCAEKYRNHDYYQQLVRLVPELEKSDYRIKSKRVPSLKAVVMIGARKPGTYSFDDVLNLGIGTTMPDEISPDDPCIIHFTSGTTGKPKAAVSSHFSLVNNGGFLGKRMGLSQEHHTICLQVPFFHAFGTVAGMMATLNHGGTLVLPSEWFNADKSLTAIKENKCTMIYGTPTMYVDLVEAQKNRQEIISLKGAFVGGALCPPTLIQKIQDTLNVEKISVGYGLTEVTGILFQSLLEEPQNKPLTSVGYISEHVEAKVVDEKGKMVPFGTPGELCVRIYSTMLGYWNDEEKTREILSRDGWIKSGDLFVLQEDGYGRVVGRIKDIIIRGGENIHANEIEDHLNLHPDILEVHVIGLPDERLGEAVCACIRVKPGSNLTEMDIVDFCKGELAYFKIPSSVKFLEEFPKTTTGKVQKFKLREMFTNVVTEKRDECRPEMGTFKTAGTI